MKNYPVILALIFVLSPVIADDEVYLNLNPAEIHQYQKSSPDLNNETVEKDDEFDTDMILHPFKYIKNEFIELKSEEKKN